MRWTFRDSCALAEPLVQLRGADPYPRSLTRMIRATSESCIQAVAGLEHGVQGLWLPRRPKGPHCCSTACRQRKSPLKRLASTTKASQAGRDCLQALHRSGTRSDLSHARLAKVRSQARSRPCFTNERSRAPPGFGCTRSAPGLAVQVRPNHSLKRSASGRPPGPGCRYAVHCLQPGPGNLPLAPA